MRKEMYEIAQALKDAGHAAGASRVRTMATLMHEQGAIPDDLTGYAQVRLFEPSRRTDRTNADEEIRILSEKYAKFDPADPSTLQTEPYLGVLDPDASYKARASLHAGEVADEISLRAVRLTSLHTNVQPTTRSALNACLTMLERTGIATVGDLRATPVAELAVRRSLGVNRAVFMKHTFRFQPPTTM
jgi:hypothetical protein